MSGFVLVASLSLLSACGGGGSSGTVTPPTPNASPVANAGPNQTVTGGSAVTLDGSGSSDSDGTVSTYTWTQTAGTAVTLSSASVSQPNFTAPATSGTLTFSLTVTDNRGASSTASSVTITVNGVAASTVTGQVNYVRIPFSPTLRNGLDYTNPQNKPARGVTVNAVAAGTTTPVLATATTDDNGNYSLNNVPAGTSINIQVVAQLVKTGALPNWNFTVRDLPATLTSTPNPLPDIYIYTDAAFTPSGATHNILIPSGYSTAASPTVTGVRASAPFAILDTVYQAVKLVTGAKSDASFPTLVLDWGTNNLATDGTFYTSSPLQHIVLSGDITADTDEFDQHVIAHEFGHYIEHNFSRADNIGGSHGLGDKLDPRVAFGEGFGYAFGAMVLNDPVTRDSFVDTTPGHTLGCPNDQCSSTFNVENNPSSTPSLVNTNYGCWCSESSVWSILWDVFDAAPDANDTLNLGFTPIWNVLTTDQKNTPAFTTIFSFITALKTQNAANANVVAAINTLVAAQNINSTGIDVWGSAESNVPLEVPSVAALPIYATMTIGGPQATLRTVNDAGPDADGDSGNKLGNHRFIRFTGNGSSVTINATSTSLSPDVDFSVFQSTPTFGFANSAMHPPTTNPETLLFGTAANRDYLIDVYDCKNGCEPTEGAPGDFDLTVTVQ